MCFCVFSCIFCDFCDALLLSFVFLLLLWLQCKHFEYNPCVVKTQTPKPVIPSTLKL